MNHSPRHRAVTAAFLAALVLAGCQAQGTNQARSRNKSLDQLITELKHSDKDVRFEAAEGIRLKGQEAKKAIPDLIAAFDDEDRGVRRRAVEALTPIIHDAFPDVLQAAKHEKARMRAGAMLALGLLNQSTPEELFVQGLPVVLEGLKDQDASVRENAASALNRFHKRALPHLEEMVRLIKEDSNKHVRCWLIHALGTMGPDANAALPVLKDLQKDPDGEVSTASKVAYKAITGEGWEDEPPPSGPPANAPRAPGGFGGGGGRGGARSTPPSGPPPKPPVKDE